MPPVHKPLLMSVGEALAATYADFHRRFGSDVLWIAFESMTDDATDFMAEHVALAERIDRFLEVCLNGKGAARVLWMAQAKTDPELASLLIHGGVRWWRARDDLLRSPDQTTVVVHATEGLEDHVSLQLLKQMLYRGAAPDTKRPLPGPAPDRPE